MKRFNSIKSKLVLMLISVIIPCFAASFGYYFYVLDLIHDKESVYVANSINQVIQNIHTSSQDMVRFAKMASTMDSTQDFLTSTDALERLESSKNVFNSIYSITQDSQELAIVVIDNNGTIISPKPLLSVTEELINGVLTETSSGFTGKIFNYYDNTNYFAYYQPISDVKYEVQRNRTIGYCIVLNSINTLQTCIDRVETTPNSLFFILDSEKEVIVSNTSSSDTSFDELLQKLRTQTLANESVQSINGEEHLVFYQDVPDTNWLVIGAVPLNEINSDLNAPLILGIVMLILMGILFAFWAFSILRSIALPVLEISKFVQGDAYSKLHKRLHLKNQNEIGILAEQINQMLDQISEMTHTIFQNTANMYELDLAKKKAELSALQSQINPHFLYNTLDCIKGYGLLLESNEVVQIVDSLSQIMRYCIKGSEVVSLSDELHIIEQYLSIISIRFDNRFIFNIDIPEEIQKVKIPRFILQPIIENAIYHGLEPKYGPGRLDIYCQQENEKLQICIQDDGMGMSPELLSQINEQLMVSKSQELFQIESDKSLALLNIHQRIQQFFGPECGLTLESEPGKGTLVRINIIRLLEPPQNNK